MLYKPVDLICTYQKQKPNEEEMNSKWQKNFHEEELWMNEWYYYTIASHSMKSMKLVLEEKKPVKFSVHKIQELLKGGNGSFW